MNEHTVVGGDGVALRCAVSERAGDKPWLALIMPFGLRVALARPFFDFFRSHYKVVTWESRLILDPPAPVPGPEAFAVACHVRDLETVLASCGAEEAILTGYCSGAGIALAAAATRPELVTDLILAHGEYTLLDEAGCTTPFAGDIDRLLSLVAAGDSQARLVFEKLSAERFAGNANIPEGIDLPFSALHYLRRYAINYLAYKQTDFRWLASSVVHDTLLLTGQRDNQANERSTRTIFELIANGEIHVDPQGDHYGIVRERSETLITIWNYLSTRDERT